MSQASNYLETKLGDHILKNTAYTQPTTVYVALYTSDPTDADVGSEVSGGSYARQSVAFGTGSNGVYTNSADITFPTATGSWGTVTHFGIRDASTAGNLLVYGTLGTSKVITSGDIVKILAGQLSVTIA